MSDLNVLATQLRQQAGLLAGEMDYAGADAKTLLSEYIWATEQLDIVKRDCDFLNSCRKEPRLIEQPQAAKQCLELYEQLFGLAAYFLATISATGSVIEKRINENGVNRSFGLLMLGHLIGNADLQNEGLTVLYKVAYSIAYKNGWYHPDKEHGWRGVANLGLAKEVSRFHDQTCRDVLERMIEKGFAYIWSVLLCDIKDEIKRLMRQPPITDQDPDLDCFPSTPTPEIGPNSEADRHIVIKLFRRAAGSEQRGVAETLTVIADILSDVESWIDMNDKQIRARVVNTVAKNLSVSPQQARTYLRKLEREARSRETLKALTESLRSALKVNRS